MRKIAALALAMSIIPSTALADSSEAGQKVTVSGNYSYQGSITGTNLNPIFTSPGGYPMTFDNGGASFDYYWIMNTNLSLVAANVSTNVNPGLAPLPIYGFSIECLPYNDATAVAGPANYPYSPETVGIAGGTVTIREIKSVGSEVTVGTVVLPTSPHGGPYVNTATSRLNTPYVPTLGSVFVAKTTNVGPQEGSYTKCTVSALLQ